MSRDSQNRNMAAEPVDPTADTPLAPAMAPTETRATSAVSALGMPTPTTDDMLLSDDSFANTPSPEIKRNIYMKRDRQQRSGSRKRMVMTNPRAASAGATRGMARPPSPAMSTAGIPEHRAFSPTDATVEARLAALEMQQSHDHAYLGKVREVVTNLEHVTEHHKDKLKQAREEMHEHTQMGFQLRQELFATRDKLDESLKAGIIEASQHLAKGLDTKLQDIEGALKAMQTTMTNTTERENMMAQYLEGLQGTRPQEGQAIIETFRRVDHELGSVKERIQAYEHKVATGPAQLFPTSPPARR